MKARAYLGTFLNQHKLCKRGAEVGVRSGAFSVKILKRWRGRKLFLVDAWRPLSNYYDSSAKKTIEEYDKWHELAKQRTKHYRERVVFVRMMSSEAAALFPDGHFDFVYIDANHGFDPCTEDLHSWYPKVRPGGLFSGHDYYHGQSRKDGQPRIVEDVNEADLDTFGAKLAVDRFAVTLGKQVSTTIHDQFPSWWFFK